MTASRAQEMARGFLAEALPRRWAHVQGVAGKAQRVAVSLALSEALVAAAWLHDVGYAPDAERVSWTVRYLVSVGARRVS